MSKVKMIIKATKVVEAKELSTVVEEMEHEFDTFDFRCVGARKQSPRSTETEE